MRLKEIKPGMVIHCTNKKHVKYLFMNNIAESYLLNKNLTVWVNTDGGWMPEIDDDGETGKHYYESEGYECVEFSDLILPELTVEEVLKIRNELDAAFVRDYLGIFCETSLDKMLRTATPEQIIDMCHQWKATHEKKEPEVEWFWQGRIYEVGNNGQFYQIKDGAGFYDTGCECRENAEEYMSDELKKYCKTHEGDYIAVVEHVCRVKAVK